MIGLRTGLRLGPRVGLAPGVETDELGDGAAPPAFSFRNKLGFIGGQSNAVGIGNTTHIDSGLAAGFQASVSLAAAQLAHHCAPAVADPPSFTDVPSTPSTFRNLQPYAAPGSFGMGTELSLIRYLLDADAIDDTTHWGKMGISGSDISRWLPGSGYPTSGTPLFTQLTDYIDSLIAATGKQLGIFVWIQGESDSDSDAEAAAYQTRLSTLVAALRVKYGDDFLFVISRLNDNQIGGFTNTMTAPRVAAVQAAQDAVAAASPSNTICINTNRAPTNASQKEHYLPDGYWRLGNILGAGIAAAIAPTRNDNQGSGPAPWHQWGREGSTGNDSSNGDITIYPQVEQAAGDIEVLCAMHASSTSQNALPALTTANGFVQTGSASQTIFSATTIVSLAAFLRTADGNAPQVAVLTDQVTRKRGLTFSVRGSSGVDVQSNTNLTTNAVSHTIQGVTTTVDNCRVFFIVAYFSGSPAAVSAFTAAGLTDVVIHRNTYANNNGQNACKFAVMSGRKAAAGATGTATFATGATATVATGLCIAFKP